MGEDAVAGRVLASCSFCLKPNTEVNSLVGGPGVYICDGCVELCVELLKQPKQEGRRLAPWEQEVDDEVLLGLLPQIAAAGTQVDQALTKWVEKARGQGISWARIGNALGITRQSAWERFSDDA